MDPQAFLDNFATIAEAPGGPQRLRELVLELAVRGRLVEQRREDEPTSAGLFAVKADKGDTLADSIRGGGAVPRVPEPAEHDGDLPPGWEWARIDDTGDYVNGLAFKNSDWKSAGIPIIRIQNLTNPSVPFNYADGPFPEDRMAHDGDILVSWSATLNAFRWYRGDAVVNQHIFKVIPDHRVVTTDYLFHLLRYCIRAMAESEAAHGLVMKHINRGPFLSHVVSLPPLAEQERIVAKVDELMDLCNDLEGRQERRQDAATLFRSSSLHALRGADTSDQVLSAWQRTDANWTLLTDESSCTQPLQETIVDLAVRGHLSERQNTDRDASIDLNEARARKRQVPGLRKQPSLDAGTPTTALPDGWIWAMVDDLFLVTGGIQKSPKRRPKEHHFPYLRVANVQRGKLDLTELERFELADGELERLRLEPGDLLVVEGNGSESEIGRCARWTGEIPDCVHQNHLIRCRPMLPGIEHYLLLFLNSPLGMETMKDLAVTTSGLYNLSVSKIRAITFPMPPIAEQERICAEVDELLRLLEILGESLQAREQVGAALSVAATAALTH